MLLHSIGNDIRLIAAGTIHRGTANIQHIGIQLKMLQDGTGEFLRLTGSDQKRFALLLQCLQQFTNPRICHVFQHSLLAKINAVIQGLRLVKGIQLHEHIL